MSERTNKTRLYDCIAYGLLALAGSVTFIAPRLLTIPQTVAAPGDTVRITGIVRDFPSGHVDFATTPAEGIGHTAGNVKMVLGASRRPLFAQASGGDDSADDIDLVAHWSFDEGAGTTVGDTAGASPGTLQGDPTWEAGMVGTALRFDGDDYVNIPSTPMLEIADDVTISGWFMLDAPFDGATASTQLIMEKYLDDEHDTTIALVGTDYGRAEPARGALVFKTENGADGDHYRYKWTNRVSWSAGVWYHFAAVMDISDSTQNRILIDGVDDTAAADAGIYGPGIDWNYSVDFRIGGKDADAAQLGGPRYFTGLIDEVMIFERALTEDDFAPPTGGFRVATQWTDAAANYIAPHVFAPAAPPPFDDCGAPLNDVAGVAGVASDGGITSDATFREWFHDTPGVNMSARLSITLTEDAGGVLSYLDDAFYPVDDQLLGNEGDAHNTHFTYAMRARFTYDACTGQFIEFEGGDGAWLFVDGSLVIDLGGVSSGHVQRVDLDRLGLTDSQPYALDLFYAQRRLTSSRFRLRTNVDLAPAGVPTTVSAMFD